jgi:hypothetical protein
MFVDTSIYVIKIMREGTSTGFPLGVPLNISANALP